MKFYRLHGESSDGTEDSITFSGDTEEDCFEEMDQEIDKRGWKYCWFEEIKGPQI